MRLSICNCFHIPFFTPLFSRRFLTPGHHAIVPCLLRELLREFSPSFRDVSSSSGAVFALSLTFSALLMATLPFFFHTLLLAYCDRRRSLPGSLPPTLPSSFDHPLIAHSVHCVAVLIFLWIAIVSQHRKKQTTRRIPKCLLKFPAILFALLLFVCCVPHPLRKPVLCGWFFTKETPRRGRERFVIGHTNGNFSQASWDATDVCFRFEYCA
eukprot:RCo023233